MTVTKLAMNHMINYLYIHHKIKKETNHTDTLSKLISKGKLKHIQQSTTKTNNRFYCESMSQLAIYGMSI